MTGSPAAILGLDIGTTSAKAVLFDLTGVELATAQQTIPLQTPKPGWAEQQPDDLWAAVVAVLRRIVTQAGSRASHIAALSVASQGGSLAAVTSNGVPVCPIITWMDSRAAAVVRRWRRNGTADTIRRISGWHPQPGLTLSTLVWLREERPDLFAAADRYLAANDFVIHWLSGRFCTDLTCANEMLLMDVARGQWSDSLCALAGIGPEQLSQLRPSGGVIGPITAEVSRQTGLPPNTLVVNGGHDHCCEGLALGITNPGQLLLTCGTAWVITGVTDTPNISTIPSNLDLNFHVMPERWTVSQFLGGLGAAIEWWLRQSWQPLAALAGPDIEREALFAAFDKALTNTQPGSSDLLFLPLGGSLQQPGDAASRGGFIGLRLDHTRAEMSRAILEGAAFELRWALDTMAHAGLPIGHLWLLGGATKSPIWPQILADVTGVPLSTTQYAHWAAAGAAILAGVGAGLFSDAAEGQARFQKTVQAISPSSALQTLYKARFETYRRVSQAVGEAYGEEEER